MRDLSVGAPFEGASGGVAAMPLPSAASIGRLEQLFAEQAALTPDRHAILYRGLALSYGTLDRLSNRIAHHLRNLGVGRNMLVGICMERSPQMIAAMLGVLKAGGAYLPLDPAYPAERLAFMLSDSAAPLILTRGSLPTALSYSGRICNLDAAWTEIEAAPDDAVPCNGAASDLAYVIYTSGSTGQPKGVMLAHSATGLINWFKAEFDFSDIARIAACTSICFDPSIIEIFGALCTGGLVILKADALEPFEPGECPTVLSAPPSVLSELARMRAIPDSVRVINVGGEAIAIGLVRTLYECSSVERIYNHYGPTEATTCTSVALVARDAMNDPPIGRPIAGARVYVLDEDGERLPDGSVGELFIAGPTVALGYLGSPAASKERFLPDPFKPGERMYRTGDLGLVNENGELEFKGRRDTQVKLRGFRIELGDVEAALMRLQHVRQAAALVKRDERGRDRLVAYVASDQQISLVAARRQLATWLPNQMLPSKLIVLDALPLGPTGKIDRAALSCHRDTAPTCAAPSYLYASLIERIIAGVFARHLSVFEIGPEDDLFEFGGDSLLAIEVAMELEALLGKAVSPAMLAHNATPGALARALATQAIEHTSVLTPLQPSGNRPAIFCTPELYGRPLSYVSLARRLAPSQPVMGLGPGPFSDRLIAEPDPGWLSQLYLDAIRSVQPTGPYIVSGYSFGVIQAFDLARLLESQGERVLLILIDGPIHRTRPSLAYVQHWARRQAPKAIAEKGWQRTARNICGSRRLWTRLLTNSKRPVRPKEIPRFVPNADRAIARSLMQTMIDYDAKPFGGPSVLIRCTDPHPIFALQDEDGWLGWRGLLTGPVHHANVVGTHTQIMQEPQIADIQAILQKVIADFMAS